jgi:hypothetical protein
MHYIKEEMRVVVRDNLDQKKYRLTIKHSNLSDELIRLEDFTEVVEVWGTMAALEDDGTVYTNRHADKEKRAIILEKWFVWDNEVDRGVFSNGEKFIKTCDVYGIDEKSCLDPDHNLNGKHMV